MRNQCKYTTTLRAGKYTCLETTDVVRSVREARRGQAQCAAERLSHSLEGRLAVTTPVHGETLTADGGGTREDDGLTLAEALLEEIEDDPVVHDGVGVVDAHRVGTVVEHDVRVGNTLSKVGLEGVDAQVKEQAQLVGEPLAGCRVREVDNAETRLPEVPSA